MRLVCVVAFAATLWLTYGAPHWPSWITSIPAIAFVVLVAAHVRTRLRRDRDARLADLYATAIARIEDKWPGSGATGDVFLDPEHLFAADLDLFGKGSLFQFLSRARTGMGERTLANWLLAPASIDEARLRQEAVRELAPLLDLREQAALVAASTNTNDEAVRTWTHTSASRLPDATALVCGVIAMACVGSVIAFFLQVVPLSVVAVAVLVSAAFQVWLKRRLAQSWRGFEKAKESLESCAQLLALLERQRFASPWLQSLHAAIVVQGRPASRRVARLRRWIELAESSHHILLSVLNPILLLRQQAWLGIDRWRAHNSQFAEQWLNAIANFEAVSSLAWLAYERENWAFPEVCDGEAQFAAEALFHPLLPAASAVANDLSLSRPHRLLIVSGSNMSGKSTLLRAAGLATVLAFAGAPVPASRLRLSHLHTGASLRANDSLLDNRSRFFSEITRLRAIVALAASGAPVLFLLDELLSGTNSHDRLIGAAAILRTLLAENTIGMMTTHDLALAGLDRELPDAVNAHFEDQFVAGEIRFDYKLRPGVVTRSNALALMRAVGLTVSD